MNQGVRRPAESVSRRLRAGGRFRRSRRAHLGALSTQSQTALRFAHARIRRGVRISTICSGCGRKPARPRVIRDSCHPARKPILPMLPTTLEALRDSDKSHGTGCNLFNNGVLPRWTRTLVTRIGGVVASYGIPEYSELLGMSGRSKKLGNEIFALPLANAIGLRARIRLSLSSR